jgi:hypothetical protein
MDDIAWKTSLVEGKIYFNGELTGENQQEEVKKE